MGVRTGEAVGVVCVLFADDRVVARWKVTRAGQGGMDGWGAGADVCREQGPLASGACRYQQVAGAWPYQRRWAFQAG